MMPLIALALIALFGLGPVAVVFALVSVLGNWAIAIPVAYVVITFLFD